MPGPSLHLGSRLGHFRPSQAAIRCISLDNRALRASTVSRVARSLEACRGAPGCHGSQSRQIPGHPRASTRPGSFHSQSSSQGTSGGPPHHRRTASAAHEAKPRQQRVPAPPLDATTLSASVPFTSYWSSGSPATPPPEQPSRRDSLLRRDGKPEAPESHLSNLPGGVRPGPGR